MKSRCREKKKKTDQPSLPQIETLEQDLQAMVLGMRQLVPDEIAAAKQLAWKIQALLEAEDLPLGAAMMGTAAALGSLCLCYLQIKGDRDDGVLEEVVQ